MKIKSREMADLIANSVLMDMDICPPYPIRFHPPFGPKPGRRRGWPWPDPPKPMHDRLAQLLELRDSLETRRAAALVSGLLVDHLYHASKSMQYMDKTSGLQAYNQLSSDIISITGECGTVPIREVIRRLMKLLGLKFPPIPEPDPNPVYDKLKFSKLDQLVVHSVLVNCASEFDNHASIAVVNSSLSEIDSLLK